MVVSLGKETVKLPLSYTTSGGVTTIPFSLLFAPAAVLVLLTGHIVVVVLGGDELWGRI